MSENIVHFVHLPTSAKGCKVTPYPHYTKELAISVLCYHLSLIRVEKERRTDWDFIRESIVCHIHQSIDKIIGRNFRR